MIIDTTSYPLSVNNYNDKIYDKKQILICNNHRQNMLHYGSWLYRHNGKYKKTTPYTIDKSGNIYQHYDPKYYSNILNNEMDKTIIGITLVNEGGLKIDHVHNRYFDWLGNIYTDKNNIFSKKWRNNSYWIKYPDEQLVSLVYLLETLCDEFQIQKQIMSHNVYDEDVDLFDGIVFRSNYINEASDVSPAFDIEKFKTIING